MIAEKEAPNNKKIKKKMRLRDFDKSDK